MVDISSDRILSCLGECLAELNLSNSELARRAKVNETFVRRVITGESSARYAGYKLIEALYRLAKHRGLTLERLVWLAENRRREKLA
jgi:predicted transcriptional regulator